MFLSSISYPSFDDAAVCVVVAAAVAAVFDEGDLHDVVLAVPDDYVVF